MNAFTLTRRLIPIGLRLLLIPLFGLAVSLEAAVSLREYDAKAGFLFNFSRFVQWPETALPPASQPLVIGVLGADPFGATLDELVQGEVVSGRPLVVERFSRKDDYTKCHILFISESESPYLKEILARLKGLPILTVSDTNRFAFVGGTIGLVVDGGRIRMQINVREAKAAQLGLSAKLLRPALIINGPQSLLSPRWRTGIYVSGEMIHRVGRPARAS